MPDKLNKSLANRLPVSIVTGFLGSGKTTLINHLVKQRGMESTALIINEFGEIGLDNLLVESAIENTLLLENGCICCSIRGDLVDTISDLFAKVKNRQIPQFSRILIETTGLADPGPILESMEKETAVTDRCRVDCVVAIVDGLQGTAQTKKFEEAVVQVAHADIGLISKCDLSSIDEIGQLKENLSNINPTLVVRTVKHGQIDPDFLFSGPIQNSAHPVVSGRKDGHKSHRHKVDDGEFHHGDISSWSFISETPLDEVRLREWLSMVYSLRPYAMLRMKGIIRLSNSDQPTLMEGVGNVVSPPRFLESWPEKQQKTQLEQTEKIFVAPLFLEKQNELLCQNLLDLFP